MRVLRLFNRADLGWRIVRGLDVVNDEADKLLGIASLVDGAAAFVRMKLLLDGLKKSLPRLFSSVPLDRLEKRVGSRFSKSSVSTSDAFLLIDAGGRAIER